MDTDTINAFLEKIGLTEYEAKTLSSLFRLKEAEAPEISRSAQVPKTRVYDVLERLTKRGLVIETYGRPKKYRVIDSGSVFNELLNKKKDELKSLEEDAKKIKSAVGELGSAAGEQTEKVIKVKDRQDFIKILAQELGNAKAEVVAFSHTNKSHQPILTDALKKLSSKKVKVRILGNTASEAAQIAKDYNRAGVSTRELDHGLHAYIVDGKKVVLALSDFSEDKPEYHFAIWPEHREIASAFGKYFNEQWKKGK